MNAHDSGSVKVTDRRLGRRSLLKAVGATSLAASLSPVLAGTARATEETRLDAIVIGAGYAGGTVARELGAKGLRTLVLEARDRIGGRIWTGSFAGQTVDFGGGWLGPQQELAQKEVARYGIKTFYETPGDRAMMPGDTGLVGTDLSTVSSRLSGLFKELFKNSESYFEHPADPLFRKDLLAAVDPLSLEDRLRQLSVSPVDLKWLNGGSAVYAGGSSSWAALTSMAQWYQLAGGTYEGFESTMGIKPVGGMTELLKAMLADSKAMVKLSSPVSSVTEANGKVTVQVQGGGAYTAPVAVVATPANVWKSITFNPGLPKAHTQATTQGMGVPHATKIWVLVQGKVDAVYGQAPEGSPILMLVPQQQLPEGRLFVAFGGPSLDTNDKAKVQTAVQAFLPGAVVSDYRATAWHADKYAMGGWGMRRPNQLLQLFPQIEQPHGRIVFAGADIAKGWHGAFIEGAIESGLRAAQQAATLAG
ncbi:flavin monoamine oxidase family protein [Streptomyces abikoensis]|uniref:flavin monoamine oxidase family protein n=1 Tax=Streptomyces abikoensis TaxID=97398 RepID=UPI003406980C